jgi:hypothetical protein
MDLFTSVVGGLAIVAAEDGGVKPRYAARYAAEKIIRAAGKPLQLYAFRIGEKCYRDAEYTLARIPADLSGLPVIKTAQADKANTAAEFLEFELLRKARVFIAYDAAAKELPRWLRAFEPEKMSVIVNQYGAERLMNVYGKNFPAGRVMLGGNLDGAKGNVFLNFMVVIQADPKGF